MTSSDTLKKALQLAVDEVTFDAGHIEFQSHGSRRLWYSGRPDEVLDPEIIRHLRANPQLGGEPLRRLQSARVCLPDAANSAVVGALRELLCDYIDTMSDRIGHALPLGGDHSAITYEGNGICSYSESSPIEHVAVALTRGAVVAGPERIADLVTNWARGEPVYYRIGNVLPVTLANSLSPSPGIEIVPLPLSTAALPGTLPARDDISPGKYLGQTLVSVDAKTEPALFRPEGETLSGMTKASLAPPTTLDIIRDALSLECNAYIDHGLVYYDYGDFSALSPSNKHFGGTLGNIDGNGYTQSTHLNTGEMTLKVPTTAASRVSEENFARVLDKLRSTNDATRVAVSRWKSAMNPGRPMADRFIDLRITLESLFLSQQPNQELKFRLAISGAWLLGQDGKDRRRVFNILRDTYDIASKAVHRGSVKHDGDTAATFKDALTISRHAILYILHYGRVVDWTALILDETNGKSAATSNPDCLTRPPRG